MSVCKLQLRDAAGFSLIEMLVVVSIIGLLASVSLSSVTDAQTRANYAVAKQEMRQIQEMYELASVREGGVMLDITGSGCTMCPCRDHPAASSGLQVIRDSNSGPSQQCKDRLRTALTNMRDAAGLQIDIEELMYDPWGSPYLIDENELEFDHNLCRNDTIRTAGADGVFSSPDTLFLEPPIPFSSHQCRSQN